MCERFVVDCRLAVTCRERLHTIIAKAPVLVPQKNTLCARGVMPGAILLTALVAQVGVDTTGGIFIPRFDQEARFHDEVARSRWSTSQLDYIDGASSAVLRHPYTIVHAPDGELFVASFTLNHVVKLRFIEGKRAQYKVFVSGRELDGPVGMALDRSGALYVASFTNDVVLRVNATSGELLGKIGDEDTLDCPEGIAFGPTGDLYVASFLLQHLSVFEPLTGKFLGKFGIMPRNSGLHQPHPVPAPEVGSDGAASAGPAKPVATQGARKQPTLAGAEDLAFDLSGDVHVTAYYTSAIFKFNGTDGTLLYTYGKGLVHGPVGIACDPATGDIFVASYKDHKVLRFTSTGQFLGVAAGAELPMGEETSGAGGPPPPSPKRSRRGRPTISSPSGLAFAEDGSLWVASYATGSVGRFNSSYGGGRTFWRVTE